MKWQEDFWRTIDSHMLNLIQHVWILKPIRKDSKRAEIFRGASIKEIKNCCQGLEVKLEVEKAWGYFCKCGVINSKLNEYLI